MVVTCIGSHATIELNGEAIVHCHLDETPMKNRPMEGFIGFQDHGQPNNVLFRNLRVRELAQ